jgi:hypothetical protein
VNWFTPTPRGFARLPAFALRNGPFRRAQGPQIEMGPADCRKT